MIQVLNNILYYLNLASVALHSNLQNVSDIQAREEVGEGGYPLLVKQIPPGLIVPGVLVKFVCSAGGQEEEDECKNQERLSYQWEMYQYTEDRDGRVNNESVVQLPGKDSEMELKFNETVTNPKMHCDLVCKINNNPGVASIKLHFRNNENSLGKLRPPTGFSLLDVTARNAYFTWKPATWNGTAEGNITGYIIEYRSGRGKSDWINGKVFRYEIKDRDTLAVCISNLSPCSTYYFRIFALAKNISSPASASISILTPEDLPSAPPLDVKVKVVENGILRVSWKPPPRTTWNGSLLGYYMGFKKVSSPEDEPYNMHIFSQLETLRNPYVYELTVPEYAKNTDPTVKYQVVVQAFNNIGSGPFSHPVTQSTDTFMMTMMHI